MSMIWQKLMMAEAAPAGYSCNITIGNDGTWYGFSIPANLSIGSISGQPVPGHTLSDARWFDDGSVLIVSFGTNCLTLVTALNVYINSVNYGGAGDWAWDGSTTTVLLFSGPTLTSGTYLLEIK
jgi:hypothetical protein